MPCYYNTMGHFILGLHQRLILKFNTKHLIQSPKTGVKPFLGLNWCKTLVLTSVLTWIFGQQSYIVFHQPQRPRKDERTVSVEMQILADGDSLAPVNFGD